MLENRLTARDVAGYFLASVDEDSGDNLSNLKLQKLLYYAQGCIWRSAASPSLTIRSKPGRMAPPCPRSIASLIVTAQVPSLYPKSLTSQALTLILGSMEGG